MVSAVDDGVGRVLDVLKEENLDKNTIIVFLSDNGGASNNASDNGPLRGLKGDLFEGGIRVPFAIRWKGTIPKGQTYTNPVSSLDIMATITSLNNIEINSERPLDGINLMPFITGKNDGTPHDRLFWRKWDQNAMAIRKGNYKIVSNRDQKKQSPELFKIKSDISEENSLKQEEEIYEELIKDWNLWNMELKDRVFPTLQDKWWTTNK